MEVTLKFTDLLLLSLDQLTYLRMAILDHLEVVLAFVRFFKELCIKVDLEGIKLSLPIVFILVVDLVQVSYDYVFTVLEQAIPIEDELIVIDQSAFGS